MPWLRCWFLRFLIGWIGVAVAPVPEEPDLGKIAGFLLSGLRVSADRYATTLEEFNAVLAERNWNGKSFLRKLWTK